MLSGCFLGCNHIKLEKESPLRALFYIGDSAMEDLTNISTYRQRRAEQKDVTGPTNGNEEDLLNITSGSGVVNYVWLACRPNAANSWPEFDYSIRVYTDGNTTPDIDMDLGSFFGYADGHLYPQADISCAHWHARVGGTSHIDRSGGGIRLAMPFTSGIRICVANTVNTAAAVVFSQVDYLLSSDNPGMTVPPYRLYTTGTHWIGGRATLAANADATLATIAAGNPGIIVGHSMTMANATDYSYLERELAVYVDGEGSPSIQSSGTEDWFTGSDYFFSGQSPFSHYGAMGLGALYTTNTSPCPAGALVDFLALNGGYPFTGSAATTVKWQTLAAVSSACDYGSCLFYYRHT